MKGEYISIETLKIYQDIEKENKELHEKIEKAKEWIKQYEKQMNEWGDTKTSIVLSDDVVIGNLLNILGDSNEKI